ncbi:hypothetical protein AIOL_000592 [Candidatus Rhodobacter oscarellae]|uniref:DUF454 domain-containing protein n=1 Tax=Candidatus Rhodobacter oscarellae TaxID=1675527 RepID=A0A0J9ECD6_9RHOB|nr:YbaN family protein [Candidatus Rhodobacter lobularis]KMW60437.1 hypothetical protein AIOL_000592 [Candidatus Rhodobacter lobularis]
MLRVVYLLLGWLCVAVGLVGAVLPVLPTTVFMILAAYFFAKGSPRAREWLVERSVFGPHIKAWEAEGAISTRAKLLAVAMMALVFGLSVYFGVAWWVLAIQAVCLLAAGSFVLTRPAPRESP